MGHTPLLTRKDRLFLVALSIPGSLLRAYHCIYSCAMPSSLSLQKFTTPIFQTTEKNPPSLAMQKFNMGFI